MLHSRHLIRPALGSRLCTATTLRRMAVAPLSHAGFNNSLAIEERDDDPAIRERYRPFLLENKDNKADWVDDLELDTVTAMAAEDMQRTGERLKVLVLYGSLRSRLANPFASSLNSCPRFSVKREREREREREKERN